MTLDEKRKRLKVFCDKQSDCEHCRLSSLAYCDKCDLDFLTEIQTEECFEIAFDNKEEINHPDRYASGQFECIEVMVDVFGKEAVKHFCILNAFKYLWRAEKKNGVEDIKKAVFYLNYYIELGGEE